jgi:two-component system LytT family sensor kinase
MLCLMAAKFDRVLVPLRAFLLVTVVGLFVASGGGGVTPALTHWYIWGLLGWGITAIDRRLPVPQERLARRLAWHVPLSLVCVTVYLYVVMTADIALREHVLHFARWPEIVEVLQMGGIQWNLLNYWLILGAYLAFDYHRQAQERERRAVHLESLLTEARLSALRSQLHPHFLFNALNTVSAYVETDPALARAMLAHLGDLLRFSLDSEDRRDVSLAEEIAALDHYLAIQCARFAGRLRTHIDIPPELLEVRVPGLVLQPLVENAITHGLRHVPGMGEIRISACARGNDLVLTVRDNGTGLPSDWVMERDAGIGLSNTSSRLAEMYGERQQFRLSTAGGGGVIAEIRMPLGEVGKGESRAEVARAHRG